MRLPSNRRMSNAPKSRKRLPGSANRANAKNQRTHDLQRCHAYHPLKARVYLSTLTVAKGRLIKPDGGGEDVFINGRDWRCTALWFGKRMEFQMVHRPEGIYALPIQRCNPGEPGLK